MKDYNQVRSEYQGWKAANPDKDLDLAAYAKLMDEYAQTPGERGQAYNDNVVKQLNAGIDRFFQPVGDVLAPVGKAIDTGVSELGFDSRGAAEAGLRELPRAAAEFIPFAGWAGKASRLAQVGQLAGRATGMASAGANAYSDTDSVAAGLVGAAGLPVTAKAAQLGEQLAARYLTRGSAQALANTVPNPTREALGVFMGGNTGAGIAGELQRQAMISATGEGDRDPFTAENIVSNVVGTLPEVVAKTGPELLSGRGAREVNAVRAEKVQTYLDTLGTRQDQAGFESIQNELGTLGDNELYRKDILDKAVKQKNADFIEDPYALNVRQVMEAYEPFGQVKMVTDEIGHQADKLATEFKSYALETQDKFADVTMPSAVIERASVLANTSASELNDPKSLAQFIKDVNQTLKDQYELQTAIEETNPRDIKRAANLRKATHVAEDIVERPEPMARPVIDAFNPKALEGLQREGRVPQITPEFLKEKLDWHFENGITFTDQEAYHGMVQTVKNLMIDLAKQANRQKSFEIQRREQLVSTKAGPTEDQKAEIYISNIRELPENLQRAVFDKRREWEKVGNRFGFEENRLGHHQQIVNQAVKNWDRETGMTTVSVRQVVPGGYTDHTGKIRYYKNVATQMPIEEAVLLEPKARAVSKRAKTERQSVSLEALTEEGAAQEGNKIMQRADLELEDTKGLLTESDTAKVVDGKLDSGVKVELDTENTPLNERSDSDSEFYARDPSVDKVAEALIELGDPTREQATWSKYREVFVDPRGRMIQEDTRRRLFPLAVRALSGETQAVLAFGKAKFGTDTDVSNASRAVQDYWDKGGFRQKFFNKLKKDAGVPELETAALYDIGQNVFGEVSNVMDLNAGIKVHFEDHFRSRGYTPELVDHLTTVSLKAANLFGETNAKFAELKFKDLMSDTATEAKFFEDLAVMGVYGKEYDTGTARSSHPLMAMAMKYQVLNKDNESVVNFMTLSTVVHEMLHDVQHKARLGLKSPNYDVQVRAKAYENMYNHVATMRPIERYGMLLNLMDTVVPKEISRGKDGKINPVLENFLQAGTTKPQEVISRYGEMYLIGMLTGGKKVDNIIEALRWEPVDGQNFARAIYRDVSNFSEGLVQLIENPIYRQMSGLLPVPGRRVDAMAEGIRVLHEGLQKVLRPDVEVLKAKKTVAEVMGYLEPGALNSLAQTPINTKPPANPNLPGGTAIETAKVALASGVSADPTRMNWWQKTFMPFMQAASRTGNKIAVQVASTLIDNTHVKIRLNHQMLDPIMVRDGSGKKVVDPTGLLKDIYNTDSNQPSRAHRGLNNIARKMQEIGERQQFTARIVPDPTTGRMNTVFDQLVASNAHLANTVKSEFATLSPKERGQVTGALNQMLEIYRNSAEVLWKSQVDHGGARAARLMQTLGHGDANLSLERGMLLMNGIANSDATAVAKAVNGLDPKIAAAAMAFATEVNKPIQELRKLLDARPYFMSEQRSGTHILKSVNNKGESQSHGADSVKHAKEIEAELRKRGNSGFQIIDKAEKYGEFAGHLPEQYAEKFAALEAKAVSDALAKLAPSFPPAMISALTMEFQPGRAVMTEVTTKGVQKNLAKRHLVGGREDLDYIRTMKEYTGGLATSIANRSTKDRVGVMLADPTLEQVPDFKPFAETQLENVLRPGKQWVNKARTAMSAYYLGANFGSMMIEGTQNFITLVPYLIKNGDGVATAYGRLGKAIATLPEMKDSPAFNASARRGGMPGAKPEDVLAHWYQRFRDENPEGSNAFDDLEINEDKTSIIAGRNRHGNFEDLSTGKIIGNSVYQLSKFMMKTYGKISNWNSKAAFIAAFQQAQEGGLAGPEAFEYAKVAVYSTSFGGGKANQPGYVAQLSKATPLVGLVHTLQQFGMGMSSMIGTYAKDSIMNSKMTDSQKVQAKKAFATLFTTQMALSGALGMPFVGAAMAILEKQFGVQANELVREGLAQLAGDDEELGFMLGDAAMNGVASQVLGMDISSRTGVGNLVGTSSYSGFNLKDLLGPAPSLVENLFSASQNALAGEPIKVVQSLMPQTFKNTLQMYDSYQKFDKVQFMDRSNNMIMEPSVMESLKYAVGFKPTRLRQYQSANAMQLTSNEITGRQRTRELDKLAVSLLKDDPQPLIEYVQEARQADPGLDPRSLVTSVIDKAIDMSTPRDLLANRGAESKIISATMGKPLNRRSELQRLDMKEAALRKLGYPFGIRPATGKARLRAMRIDQLIEGGATRMEAVKAIDAISYRQAQLNGQWDLIPGLSESRMLDDAGVL